MPSGGTSSNSDNGRRWSCPRSIITFPRPNRHRAFALSGHDIGGPFSLPISPQYSMRVESGDTVSWDNASVNEVRIEERTVDPAAGGAGA